MELSNTAPTLTNPGNQAYGSGSIVNLQLEGSGLNPGDVLTYSAVGLPADLSINPTSGLISGTLSAPVGDYNVTARLTDQNGLFDEEIFTISISDFTSLLRINAGGPSFTFGNEDWISDQYFNGGLTFSSNSPIAGTTNDALYQTERYADTGTMTYGIPLSDGDYQVRLHFAEIFHNSAGARIFDVDIEGGQHQLTDYDIFTAAGGANIAVVETFMVTVTDGRLNIDFTTQIESAKISGIEINGINSSNNPPTIAPIAEQTLSEGSTLGIPVIAQDPDGEFAVLSVNSLPLFASFTDNMDGTGSLFLAPGFLDVGTYDITVTATDNGGLTDSETITIQVIEENAPPVVLVQENITLQEGTSAEIPVSATDPDGEVPILSCT